MPLLTIKMNQKKKPKHINSKGKKTKHEVINKRYQEVTPRGQLLWSKNRVAVFFYLKKKQKKKSCRKIEFI